jgi:hypothetical protein
MLGAAQYSKLLGAIDETRNESVCVYIPSRTRNGDLVDHEYWRTEAIRVMSKLFGGATSVDAFGGWLDDEGDGQVKEEPVSLVVSFTCESQLIKPNVLQLRSFLHRMGREAQQGEVGVLVNGSFQRIRSFDHEEK